jgi:SAM-dependent methyltransferase
MFGTMKILAILLSLLSLSSAFRVHPSTKVSRDKKSLHVLPISDASIETSTAFTSTLLPLIGGGMVAATALFKISVYSRMQYTTASLLGGMPPNSVVVEMDAIDGKNIFYLPKGVDYTAVMPIKEQLDANKLKEKNKMTEQLILESIGKANGMGGINYGLRGKLRQKSIDIPNRSVDCVISTGAITRATDKIGMLQEIARILKPGGLLLFVENDKDQIIQTMQRIFPEEIIQKQVTEIDEIAPRKKSKRKNSTDNSDIEASSMTIASDSAESTAVVDGADNKKKITKVSKPGMRFERLDNLFDPYVTGIAVCP